MPIEMKKNLTVAPMLIIAAMLLLVSQMAHAQRFMTRNGTVRFFSEAPLENIEAVNRQVNAAYDAGNGEFVFRVLIRSFQFEKALMQEHFNESYMESHKFPNATFRGTVESHEQVPTAKDGSYPVKVVGELTIKGIARPVEAVGTLQVSGGRVRAQSTFTILLADYGISIPAPVVRNIAREIEITVDVNMEKI